ncbi:MAG: LamG domain-containing protein [Cytophagia bacterium]|nr:LamG domain-containing protein [Cytophagia bacterium]NBW37683.1 LamG domain-containing protein [Cytophagia bacterium]
MKFISTRALIIYFLLFITFSCSESPTNNGLVSFSFQNKSATTGRISESAAKLLVSIKNAQGVLVHNRLEITLFEVNGEFIGVPLVLGPGNYTLEEFIVLNESNQAIYLSPIEGSELAYLVEKPLSIDFSVEEDEVTKVIPEVIEAEGNLAIDFGYTTFTFEIVNTLKFLTAAFIYNTSVNELALTDYNLSVTANGVTLYNGTQPNATTRIVVKSDFTNYTLTFSKTGYESIVRNFTKNDLVSNFETNPINVVFLPTSISTGLIAHYPFNGNANDIAGNNFHGVVNGATLTTDKHGQANAAYSFDGVNDLIRIAHNNAFNFAGSNFTISLWAFIPLDQISNSGLNDMVRKWNGNAEGYPFCISYANMDADAQYEDRLLFARYDGQGCSGGSQSFSDLVDNSLFHHIVMIKENSIIKYYINNTLAGSFTDLANCSTSNTADVTIGARGQEVRFFKGKIDNLRFYNRVLSPAEIQNLYLSE